MTTGGKKRGAVMGKLVTSGQRWSGGSVSSPRSPLELKIVSPRGVVDAAGGVGLGIVAALIGDHEEEEEDDEEYTIVTRHMPNNNSYRKVYDGNGCVFFDISPPPVKLGDHHHHQFLSSCCDECNKQLDGRDVYMYKGEVPFCSVECRSLGMWKEEKRTIKSNCSSQSQSQSQSAPSPSPNSHIFSGIFAI